MKLYLNRVLAAALLLSLMAPGFLRHMAPLTELDTAFLVEGWARTVDVISLLLALWFAAPSILSRCFPSEPVRPPRRRPPRR